MKNIKLELSAISATNHQTQYPLIKKANHRRLHRSQLRYIGVGKTANYQWCAILRALASNNFHINTPQLSTDA
jgi:hypothetical protein